MSVDYSPHKLTCLCSTLAACTALAPPEPHSPRLQLHITALQIVPLLFQMIQALSHDLSLLLIVMFDPGTFDSRRGWVSQGSIVPHYLVDSGTVIPRPWLRRVCEGQPCCVDDAIVPDQRDGHLGGLPHPLPASAELWDVGNDTQHVLLTPVHGLAFHVAEPYTQVGVEVFPCEFQHRDFTAPIDLKWKKAKVEKRVNKVVRKLARAHHNKRMVFSICSLMLAGKTWDIIWIFCLLVTSGQLELVWLVPWLAPCLRRTGIPLDLYWWLSRWRHRWAFPCWALGDRGWPEKNKFTFSISWHQKLC